MRVPPAHRLTAGWTRDPVADGRDDRPTPLRRRSGQAPVGVAAGDGAAPDEVETRDGKTARREADLREALAELEAIVHGSSDAIVVVNEDGKVREWNGAAEEMFGWSADEVVGEANPSIPDHLQDEFEDLRDRVLGGDRVANFETERKRKDGSLVEVSLSTARVEKRNGGTVGAMEVLRDITGLRESQAELEHQNARLDEFASVLSHDLRSPLTVALGQIELARNGGGDLEAAEEALNRMEQIIDDVLTLTRNGEHVEEIEDVDLGETARQAWRTATVEEAGLTVDVEGTIRADPSRLQQILENLFRNAIEHGGPEVTVTVGELDDGFYVEDDGPGIPEKAREKVFQTGCTTGDGGAGLGLSIVETIVRAHDWDVRIADGAEGGARFEFTGVQRVAT